MLIDDDNQEVIFEIKCSILYALYKLILETDTKIENAKIDVFVGNSVCLLCCRMRSSNLKI